MRVGRCLEAAGWAGLLVGALFLFVSRAAAVRVGGSGAPVRSLVYVADGSGAVLGVGLVLVAWAGFVAWGVGNE